MKKLKWTQKEDELLVSLIGKKPEEADWDHVHFTMNVHGSSKSLKQIRRR